jgi:hypothetical protein
MKSKYCAVFSHQNMNGKQFVGLTESQLIKVLIDQGVHTLLSITHDDKGPGKVRPVEGKEMISIWKQVYRRIQKRKQDGIHRQAKTRLHACILACIGLLLVAPMDHAADGEGPSITWLPLIQASPPSKIAQLREDILTFLEPLRRKLLGDPAVIVATAYFVTVPPADAGKSVFPSATATNADGTVACVLSSTQFSSLHQRLQSTEGVDQLAAARVGSLEGRRARISSTGSVLIDGTNANYGQIVDLVHYVSGINILMRVIGEVTEAVTNAVAATAGAPTRESVSIKAMLQSALQVAVPNGGAVAIWHKPNVKGDRTYMMIICPTVQPKPGKTQQWPIRE